MHIAKKIISMTLTAALLSVHFPAAAQTQNEISLPALQKQAQADYQAIQQVYGKESKEILPAVVAAFPFLFMKRSKYEALLKELEDQRALTQEQETAIREISAYTEERVNHHQAKQLAAERRIKELEKEVSDKNIAKLQKANAIYQNENQFMRQILLGRTDWKLENSLADLFVAVEGGNKGWTTNILKNLIDISQEEAEKLAEKFVEGTKNAHYSESFANKMISELARAHAQTTAKPRQATLRAIARKLLSKTKVSYIVVFAALLGGGALLQARAADNTLANRLYANNELFLQATPEELAQIAQDPQAVQSCQDIAQTLHEWATLAELDQNDLQDLQKKLTKKEITKSLQTVKAY